MKIDLIRCGFMNVNAFHLALKKAWVGFVLRESESAVVHQERISTGNHQNEYDIFREQVNDTQ